MLHWSDPWLFSSSQVTMTGGCHWRWHGEPHDAPLMNFRSKLWLSAILWSRGISIIDMPPVEPVAAIPMVSKQAGHACARKQHAGCRTWILSGLILGDLFLPRMICAGPWVERQASRCRVAPVNGDKAECRPGRRALVADGQKREVETTSDRQAHPGLVSNRGVMLFAVTAAGRAVNQQNYSQPPLRLVAWAVYEKLRTYAMHFDDGRQTWTCTQ